MLPKHVVTHPDPGITSWEEVNFTHEPPFANHCVYIEEGEDDFGKVNVGRCSCLSWLFLHTATLAFVMWTRSNNFIRDVRGCRHRRCIDFCSSSWMTIVDATWVTRVRVRPWVRRIDLWWGVGISGDAMAVNGFEREKVRLEQGYKTYG